MPEHYDVAIIGAGTAGLSALNEVRKQTGDFVLINDGPYGTTCARVGCMPSKTLIEASRAYHRRNSFREFGIRGAEALVMDIPAALARVRRLRDDFVSGTLKMTDALGDRNIAGRARLVAPDRISVAGVLCRRAGSSSPPAHDRSCPMHGAPSVIACLPAIISLNRPTCRPAWP